MRIKDYIIINAGTNKGMRQQVEELLKDNPEWVPYGSLIGHSREKWGEWEYAQPFVIYE